MTGAWLTAPWQACLWTALALGEFVFAVLLIDLMIRQKRRWALVFVALALAASYLLAQIVVTWPGIGRSEGEMATSALFLERSFWLPVLWLIAACGEGLLFRDYLRYARRQITPGSIKEAADGLPTGLCFYREGGRVVLINRAMERLARAVTGSALRNGAAFWERLRAGDVAPGCQIPVRGEGSVVVLPDGAAWQFSRKETRRGKWAAVMLTATDVTEFYTKTLALREAREKVVALNRRLTDYNREIVALTTEREILEAKVKIHDELGSDLLAIRSYLFRGGTEEERRAIVERLRLNISFLKSGFSPAARDEYELMLETAETLGVHVAVEGELPQWEPAKHILAVAIHECFTNILRHAGGGTLCLAVSQRAGRLAAVFANDGAPPNGPIREKGGLRSLRSLVERAGGRMEVAAEPRFSLTLDLPKEDAYGLPSDDRR